MQVQYKYSFKYDLATKIDLSANYNFFAEI